MRLTVTSHLTLDGVMQSNAGPNTAWQQPSTMAEWSGTR
jgi:hypothetical protein